MKFISWNKVLEMKTDVAIFGASVQGVFLCGALREKGIPVVKFIDNDKTKQGNEIFMNIWCYPLTKDNSKVIVISSSNEMTQKQIINQLDDLNTDSYVSLITDKLYREIMDNMSDISIIKCRWHERVGTELNLDNPVTFNEKIQWLKLYYHNPIYTELSDKLYAKKYVEKILGVKYVIPTIGVYDCYENIDYSKLPSKFVLKATHDSGSVQICNNRNEFDIKKAEEVLSQALSRNYYLYDREWGYKNIVPKIIAEPYYTDESGEELKDYKIFCFSGKPKLIQVDYGRFSEHKRNIYNINWEYQNVQIKYPTDESHIIHKPQCLEEMLKCAEVLSKDLPHVRVDFYVINEKVIFGEMTFYHGGGYEKFTPQDMERKMGKWIKLPHMII